MKHRDIEFVLHDLSVRRNKALEPVANELDDLRYRQREIELHISELSREVKKIQLRQVALQRERREIDQHYLAEMNEIMKGME